MGETIPAASNNHQAFGSGKTEKNYWRYYPARLIEVPARASSVWREAMPIDKDLLSILACPKCKGDIRLNEKRDGLVCGACKLMYPIKEEIPVMLIDEAIPLP
jgi:uncharacterized protein